MATEEFFNSVTADKLQISIVEVMLLDDSEIMNLAMVTLCVQRMDCVN